MFGFFGWYCEKKNIYLRLACICKEKLDPRDSKDNNKNKCNKLNSPPIKGKK